MLTIEGICERAAPLEILNLGLAEEVARWKDAKSPLLDSERQTYLDCIQAGIAGLDAAWQALTTALDRIEKGAARRREMTAAKAMD